MLTDLCICDAENTSVLTQYWFKSPPSVKIPGLLLWWKTRRFLTLLVLLEEDMMRNLHVSALSPSTAMFRSFFRRKQGVISQIGLACQDYLCRFQLLSEASVRLQLWRSGIHNWAGSAVGLSAFLFVWNASVQCFCWHWQKKKRTGVKPENLHSQQSSPPGGGAEGL